MTIKLNFESSLNANTTQPYGCYSPTFIKANNYVDNIGVTVTAQEIITTRYNGKAKF